MTEKFQILAKYIKDMSSETPDVETYISTGNHLGKYVLDLDIRSIALKNKMIQIDITLKYLNKNAGVKKSHFEIVYATIISVDTDLKDKEDLGKIILCDVQNIIYPNIEKAFLNLIHNSGFPEIKFEKKVDFEKLYNERSN